MDVYGELNKQFVGLIETNRLENENVVVVARALTPQESIGNPEDRDYPLITGRERMMQAEFRGSFGQAYTDMYGNYSGKIIDIARMELKNNFRRAVFISALSAMLRHLGLVDKTVHCKDEEPKECAAKLVDYVQQKYGRPRIAMVGLQPRIVEALAKNFELRVTDMDNANINSKKFGITIESPENTRKNSDWCELLMVTGSTIVNNTIGDFLTGKPVIFYGVTITGAAKLLGLESYCYCGK